jgi:hypothetical protein
MRCRCQDRQQRKNRQDRHDSKQCQQCQQINVNYRLINAGYLMTLMTLGENGCVIKLAIDNIGVVVLLTLMTQECPRARACEDIYVLRRPCAAVGVTRRDGAVS